MYTVKLQGKAPADVIWPKRCFSCGDALVGSGVVVGTLTMAGAEPFAVRFCVRCEKKQSICTNLQVVGIALMALGLIVGIGLVLFGVSTSAGAFLAAAASFWLGIILKWAGRAAEQNMLNRVRHLVAPAGEITVWFQSKPFCDEFCSLNGGKPKDEGAIEVVKYAPVLTVLGMVALLLGIFVTGEVTFSPILIPLGALIMGIGAYGWWLSRAKRRD